MKKQVVVSGVQIILSSVIWGLVIIACSYALRGTECYDKIQNILVGGVVTHIMLLGGSNTLMFKKKES